MFKVNYHKKAKFLNKPLVKKGFDKSKQIKLILFLLKIEITKNKRKEDQINKKE